jgi:CRISPR system Cascade subunit CasE
MYLSRISLSPEAAGDVRTGEIFNSPYRLHREIWTFFSDDPNRQRDFLYRLDREKREGGPPRVYSLSRRVPRQRPGRWRVETRTFQPEFRVGDRLRFVLRANPAVARDGSRHDVVTDALRRLELEAVPPHERPDAEAVVRTACTEWLARRGETHGFTFSPEEVSVDHHEVQSFVKPGGWQVRLAVCDFAGLLRVTDREKFLAAIRQGIGPAKGFGNGLLLCRQPDLPEGGHLM